MISRLKQNQKFRGAKRERKKLMRLAYCIVMIILLCTYIAVEEREIRIAQKEAYQSGYRKGLKECHKLPTRPIILDESTGDIDFKCSCCGHEYIVPEEHKPKYCSECGRKIDWEDRAYGMQI
jgi:hypothetical protein